MDKKTLKNILCIVLGISIISLLATGISSIFSLFTAKDELIEYVDLSKTEYDKFCIINIVTFAVFVAIIVATIILISKKKVNVLSLTFVQVLVVAVSISSVIVMWLCRDDVIYSYKWYGEIVKTDGFDYVKYLLWQESISSLLNIVLYSILSVEGLFLVNKLKDN